MIFSKKPAALKISIPQPCHQSWDGMTPVQGGKHCEACQKTVTDFTTMTDRELVTFLKKGGSGCGRFSESQLARPLIAPPVPKHSWWMRVMISAGLYVGLHTPAAAQGKIGISYANTPVPDIITDEKVAADDRAREAKKHFWEFDRPRKLDLTTMGFMVSHTYDGFDKQIPSPPEPQTSIPSLYRRMFPLKKKAR